jgi:hypothetical protein
MIHYDTVRCEINTSRSHKLLITTPYKFSLDSTLDLGTGTLYMEDSSVYIEYVGFQVRVFGMI